MEIEGKIKVKLPQEQVSASFVKRGMVITTDEQYPQYILIEFVQDRCDLMDSYEIGESVKVSINLKGREWVNPQGESKYFNTIQGWQITRVGGHGSANDYQPPTAHAGDQFLQMENEPKEFQPSSDFKEEEYDDLPF